MLGLSEKPIPALPIIQPKDHRQIIAPQSLTTELRAALSNYHGDPNAAGGEIRDILKKALEDGRAEIQARFDQQHDGLAAAASHSFLMDQLLGSLFNLFSNDVYPAYNPTKGEILCMVAAGGYGRSELAPCSDIDLLFLHHYKPSPRIEQIIESMLYIMWDLKLKVGQASRAVGESIRLARQDPTTLTAMLETRILAGDSGLYNELIRDLVKLLSKSGMHQFVEAKLAEREERHAKFGDSRYLLEPNIKEGKGGLRDLHLLGWLARAAFRAPSFPALVENQVIDRIDAKNFNQANQFLQTLRFELHTMNGRAEERLGFSAQPVIADRLGYTIHAGASGVERLMKRYFLNARMVGDLTRTILAAIEHSSGEKSWQSRLVPILRPRRLDGFRQLHGRLLPASPDQFHQTPIDMLRLFRVTAQHGVEPHPDCFRLIKKNLQRVDAKMRKDPEANQMFLDILCAYDYPEMALRLMSESGLLGRFVPDFGRVIAQMQFDMYHVYTTDEHTIRAIGILNQIERGLLKEDHPVASRVFDRISMRRALYVAVFLHDIAKGRGGDHSVLGARVAERLGPRFGLNAEETRTVAWLVLHHLALSRTATKRDLEDPQTIADFQSLVQSPLRLRMLLCLTIVDIRAVGPKTWNNWKATLLRSLYYRTEAAISGDSASESPLRHQARDLRDQLSEQLTAANWTKQDISFHLNSLRDAYLLGADIERLCTQAELARKVRSMNGKPVIMLGHSKSDGEGASGVGEITVCAADRPGLFAQIAGTLATLSISVVEARIVTLADRLIIDSFLVHDEALSRHQSLGKRLETCIEKQIDPAKELQKQTRHIFAGKTLAKQIKPHITIDNDASRSRTVIEISCGDHLGLLYRLTNALHESGLQILTARIATYGEKAVDVFYVRDRFGHKVTSETQLDTIHKNVMAAIQPI